MVLVSSTVIGCKLQAHLKLERFVHEVSPPAKPQSTIAPTMSDTQNNMPGQHSGTTRVNSVHNSQRVPLKLLC